MRRETIRRRARAGTGPILRPPPTRADVSRETSRLTGMRAAPRARRAARRQPRTGDWEPARQSGRRSERPRQSGGAPAEGAPAAAFGLNGLAPASPAEGREAGRQRTHAMHDYRGLPTEERRETPGRKKWRGRRIVHSARSLPCAGKRSVAGRSPARVPSCAPLQRVRMFHVKHSGRPGCAPPHEPDGRHDGSQGPGIGNPRANRGVAP